jgi:uncharacterized membrane protein
MANPLAILRLILGLIFVLYIPGYMLQELLFPRNLELDKTERIGLSFALSGAVVPPIALLLNWLPWGIHLWPITISISGIILLSMIGIVIRQHSLPTEEKLKSGEKFSIKKWWAYLDRTYRVVYVVLAAVMVIVSLTSFSILVTPKPAAQFTEFYILSQDGLAEDYLREITAGQVVNITTGITNREGISSIYNITVTASNEIIGQAGPITLEDQTTWEQPIEFVAPTGGDDQQIVFYLDREGQQFPYRSLRLWVDVKPAP